MCHRKAIIEFLQKQLTLANGGKYRREERIHSIIFPRGRTSDEVLFEDHNLWLVDERLAFHIFLSSDKPLKRLQVLDSASKKEPDIIVFDKAVAFSETPDVPFSSITIIEFKKPQRDDYSEKENPLTQIAKYINEIRAGCTTTASGRPMPIPQNLPFYCYVICDITPTLREWARLFELQDTPDSLGFFGYKRAFNAYFEVISYSKLVVDASIHILLRRGSVPGLFKAVCKNDCEGIVAKHRNASYSAVPNSRFKVINPDYSQTRGPARDV